MTRKDYDMVARCLRQARQDHWGDTSASRALNAAMDNMIAEFSDNDPSFEPDTFYDSARMELCDDPYYGA